MNQASKKNHKHEWLAYYDRFSYFSPEKVRFRSCKQVSIGGLPTGSTLSFYMAAANPQVNGALYLFSAPY